MTLASGWRGAGRGRKCLPALVLLACGALVTLEAGAADASKESEKQGSHRQASIISIERPARLKAFCLAPDGRVLAAVERVTGGNAMRDDVAELPGGEASAEADPQRGAVQVLTSDGTLQATWPVDFLVQALTVGPDRRLYLAGSGVVAKWDLDGHELARIETPATKLIKENPKLLAERAKQQRETYQKMYEEEIESVKKLRDASRAEQPKKPGESTVEDGPASVISGPDPASTADAFESQLKVYEESLAKVKKWDLKKVAQQVAMRLKTVNAMACGADDLFIVSAGEKGFGYAVWRMDRELKNPKQIIDNLHGCCGQMDIQCSGSDVFVAENSRHRVARFDREGKRLKSFGKRDRDGEGAGFGGCCNPMNLCFAGPERLYVSESDGQVKLFTPDGKFLERVGVAGVQEGCKNSAIAVSPDEEKVYYIDIQKSRIIVLARTSPGRQVSQNEPRDAVELAQ